MKIKLKALLFGRHRYHKLHRRHHRGPNLLHRLCRNIKRLSCASPPPKTCSSPAPPAPPGCGPSGKCKWITKKSSAPPPDVRRGSCAVYVGPEHKRFVLKTCYLEHPAFGALLQRSEEEFGFAYNGGLLIPCPVAVFEYLLRLLQRKDSWIHREDVAELILRAEPSR